MEIKKNIIVIGGGPSGLFTTYLLLKSGEKNVTCYEKTNILGGDWSEMLPEYTHSTTVLMQNSKANEIFVDSFNYLKRKNITVKEWLDTVSISPSSSPYSEILKNICLKDLFKILIWYFKNKKDIYTISLEQLSKQSKVSNNTKKILNMISNLTVDSCKGTSVGTLIDMIIEEIRPSSLFLNQSLLTTKELTIKKNILWEQLEKSIKKLGGKIYKNTEVTLKNEKTVIIKNNQCTKEHKINNNDKIIIASSEAALLNPDKFLMKKWANIDVKNFPPIGKSSTLQILFEKPLDTNIFNNYGIYSGMYTDWNLVTIINKAKFKNIKKNTLLVISIIGVNYKSKFTNKTYQESSPDERRKEIIRQIKKIPYLKDYKLPKIKKIFGGINISNWATTGLIPNGKINLKKKKNILWPSFLRYEQNIISILDSVANASIEVNKEITGKEPIKKSRKKLPLIIEYIITIIIFYSIYFYLPLLLKKIKKIIY